MSRPDRCDPAAVQAGFDAARAVGEPAYWSAFMGWFLTAVTPPNNPERLTAQGNDAPESATIGVYNAVAPAELALPGAWTEPQEVQP